MSAVQPKDRLRVIADRMRKIFFASTREEVVASLLEFQQHALHDVGWMLNRERALREKLSAALRRIQELERGAEKTGLQRPPRSPSQLEEIKSLSQEFKRHEVDRESMLDAFSEDEEEWFETEFEHPSG